MAPEGTGEGLGGSNVLQKSGHLSVVPGTSTRMEEDICPLTYSLNPNPQKIEEENWEGSSVCKIAPETRPTFDPTRSYFIGLVRFGLIWLI